MMSSVCIHFLHVSTVTFVTGSSVLCRSVCHMQPHCLSIVRRLSATVNQEKGRGTTHMNTNDFLAYCVDSLMLCLLLLKMLENTVVCSND